MFLVTHYSTIRWSFELGQNITCTLLNDTVIIPRLRRNEHEKINAIGSLAAGTNVTTWIRMFGC